MATTKTSPPRKPTPVTSAQPGGGRCVRLELAWARLRRALLRRYWPGYVARMAELRRGSCPNCPHDIIDSRDLKYARPVCGYRFRPEDDPYRWRDGVGVARHGFAEIFCFSLFFAGCAAAAVVAAQWVPWALVALGPITLLWACVVAFFRDPERPLPEDARVLVSPADGTVTHLENVTEDGDHFFRVSIFLSVLDVHVNRAPRECRVRAVRYFPGDFTDARNADSHARNEQLWLDLEDARTGRRFRVKQIAGAIARRIVCWARVGETLAAGQRFGLIKFGSRTDVLIPAGGVQVVLVKVGQKVRGGSTALLRVE